MRLASKLALAAPLLVCMLASSASAQGWMADRSRREGPGLRVGNLELHPGLGIEAGYDTNVFFEDQDPDGSFLLRLTGHLDVSTLGGQRRAEGEGTEGEEGSHRKLDFRGGVAASYYHFFVDEARDNVALDAYLNATINPEGRFSVYVHDEFSRAIRPFVDLGGDTDGGQLTYARDRNVAGAELRLQSAGGVLKGALGWSLFGISWGLAAIGIVLKLFLTGRFDRISTAMYVVMGWIIVRVCQLASLPVASCRLKTAISNFSLFTFHFLPLQSPLWL